jgi:uncharacterized protein YndB with AHSA1/START domain
MTFDNRTLTFEQLIAASPAALYHAFTNSTTLRNWLADVATTAPRPGGRIYLATNQGDYMAGAYTALDPDREVAFTWQGNGEPGPSRVRVTFAPEGDATRLLLRHEGLGSGPEWQATVDALEKQWPRALENLASLLTTGEDLRFTRRPMLGITVGDLDRRIAAEIGVPVTEGMRLDTVLDGMGAASAGLQPNDVVVGIDGREVRNWETLSAALADHRSDDTVEVTYYRGPEKRQTRMTLSGRPIPELPATTAGLAEAVRQRYDQIEEELDSFFADVGDEAALYKPGAESWSAAEILAHLIHDERYQFQWIARLVDGHEPWQDDWGSNDNAQVAATVSAYPTLDDLLGELKRHFQETVAYVANLPASVTERKGSYWRLAYNLIESPYHFHTHLEQMREAIAAAPQAVP